MTVRELIEMLQQENGEDYVFINTQLDGLCIPLPPKRECDRDLGRVLILEAKSE